CPEDRIILSQIAKPCPEDRIILSQIAKPCPEDRIILSQIAKPCPEDRIILSQIARGWLKIKAGFSLTELGIKLIQYARGFHFPSQSSG
ncbi:MAG: hypothetical protein V1490_00995, partial [Candidatus Omnitrophota bacterium]